MSLCSPPPVPTSSFPGTTDVPHVRVHSSVRRYLRHYILIGGHWIEEHDGILWRGDDVPESYFVRLFVRIAKSDRDSSSSDAAAATRRFRGRHGLECICAVDGLRSSFQNGEETPNLCWLSYLDNLKYPYLKRTSLDPTSPSRVLREQTTDDEEEDPMEAHVHGVRAMYPLLGSPAAVHDALMEIYRPRRTKRTPLLLLPHCGARTRTVAQDALLNYAQRAFWRRSIPRTTLAVADRLQLDLRRTPWRPRPVERDCASCGDERCPACHGEKTVKGTFVWHEQPRFRFYHNETVNEEGDECSALGGGAMTFDDWSDSDDDEDLSSDSDELSSSSSSSSSNSSTENEDENDDDNEEVEDDTLFPYF